MSPMVGALGIAPIKIASGGGLETGVRCVGGGCEREQCIKGQRDAHQQAVQIGYSRGRACKRHSARWTRGCV